MQILPLVLAQEKEKYETFFVHLVNVYLKNSTLRFALVDQDITFAGQNYISFPAQIGAIKNSVDSKRDSVDITISDCTDVFKIALLSGEDFRSQTLEVIKIVYPESLSDSTAYQIVFSGPIDAPSLDDGKSEFKCTVKDPLSNYDCGRTLMLSCNAEFADVYDCGATKAIATGIVQSGSTQTTVILQQSYDTDYWKYGLLTINGQTIQIMNSGGTQVKTEYPFLLSPSGDYSIQSGCSKAFAWCKSRYNNGMNFSGCPAIPFELIVKS